MAHIGPVKREAIDDAELRALIDQAVSLGVPDALFAGIVARVPHYAKALLRAMLMSHTEGQVDHRLKEIIRVQLAGIARDPYFSRLRSTLALERGLTEERIAAGSGNYDNDPQFSEAEKWALRYAERMYLAPSEVDAAFYAQLKVYYTEAQIMELGAFIALHYGMQAFMRTLGSTPDQDQ
jgi:alkylhydroperoxidase family enzyme